MAESPDTVASGNLLGQDNDNDLPPRERTTAGPRPPAENRTCATEAAGAQPSAVLRNDRSMSAQEPSLRLTRCGITAVSAVNPPDGLANTWVNSVRADPTSTRCPDRRAVDTADAASGATATSAVGGAGGGAACTRPGPVSTEPASTQVNARSAVVRRRAVGR
ncbi:hypothetical protein [Micromonospora wenchangensis]|uniref:hypothetical protein n=1 Tax=Micromonospora wenchangensis TaxID=1185415 RepID=UPI003D71EC7E